MAAKRGLVLPEFPQPTHVTPGSNKGLLISPEECSSFSISKRRLNCAPLNMVTIGDAISDLPLWEW